MHRDGNLILLYFIEILPRTVSLIFRDVTASDLGAPYGVGAPLREILDPPL